RGVDDDVRLLADGQHPLAYERDAVEERAVALERVRPPHLLEPAHEYVVPRLEEHDPHVHGCPELRDDLAEFGEEAATANVGDDRDLRERVPRARGDVDEGAQHPRWEVVVDVPA